MTSIPASVKKALSSSGVTAMPIKKGTSLADRVEVVLLEDEQGIIQVFFPATAMLDLSKVKQATGRQFHALGRDDRQKLLSKKGLATIPAIDQLLNLETLIDEQLMKRSKLILYAGSDSDFFQVSDPAKLVSGPNSQVADICIPPPVLHLNDGMFEMDKAQILESLSNFTQKRIHQRLEETLEIPPLSDTARAIIKLRSDPDADIEALSRIVEKDPSLAAQVVSWASSSYYAAPGQIRSIQDAIIRVLGFDLVLNLALGLSLGKSLELPKNGPEGHDSYWKQAVFSAASQGALLNLMPRELRPTFGLAYLSGLLHNFGYLIIAHVFPPYFDQISRLYEVNTHLKPQQIEQHIIGITRDQIAALLLKSWQLPEEVVYAVRFQNMPYYDGVFFDYSRLNYVAHQLLVQHDLIQGPTGVVDPKILESLHMDADLIPEVMAGILTSREELLAIASQME